MPHLRSFKRFILCVYPFGVFEVCSNARDRPPSRECVQRADDFSLRFYRTSSILLSRVWQCEGHVDIPGTKVVDLSAKDLSSFGAPSRLDQTAIAARVDLGGDGYAIGRWYRPGGPGIPQRTALTLVTIIAGRRVPIPFVPRRSGPWRRRGCWMQ